MRTIISKIITLAILPLLLIMLGCKKEYKTITKINPDGTCERTFIVTTGAQNTNKSVLPLPYDSTWKPYWVQDTASKGDYILTAKKYFKSYDELTGLYERINNPNLIKVNLKIEKRFRWFYTYYNYDEKYKMYNLFNKVPISKYLTQKELDNYIAGKKDDSVKVKVNKWEERNYLEDFIDGYVKAAIKLNDPSLSEKIINDRKEELIRKLAGSKGDTDSMVTQLNSFYKTKSFSKIKDVIDKDINSITKRAERMGDADGNYINSVSLPGLIVTTNADKIEGNKVSWEFESQRFTLNDFEMKAESRVMNVWAVVVSGIAVLLILTVLLIPVFKRRDNGLSMR